MSTAAAAAASQRPELSLDTTVWTQYYHCVIRNIPHEMTPPVLTEHVMVQESSEAAAAMAQLGRRIVLHTMYTYKETLSTKFGYLGFFLYCSPDACMDEETKMKAHRLVKQWIKRELSPQLLIGRMSVTLAQPAGCYHARPFLKEFRDRCSLSTKAVSPDPMKMETFLFTHIAFHDEDADPNGIFNPTWATQGESYEASSPAHEPTEAEHSEGGKRWSPVGTFSVASLTPQELLWMKKNLTKFPPLSITNGDLSTAHADTEALVKYFTEHLSPLVVVTK